MLKMALGLLLGLIIGAGCRWLDLPVPAPPTVFGSLLILSITLGYLVASKLQTKPTPPSAQVHSGE